MRTCKKTIKKICIDFIDLVYLSEDKFEFSVCMRKNVSTPTSSIPTDQNIITAVARFGNTILIDS